jgi:type IV pilus assembly protein PilO
MTVGGDFIPIDDQELDAPTYPTAFGIELTPQIQGIGIALIGVVAAGVLFNYVVQPERERNQELTAAVQERETQLVNQQATLANIEEIRAELEEAVQQRREIYSLFGNERTLDTLLLDLNQQIEAGNADLNTLLSNAGASGAQITRLRQETEDIAPLESWYSAALSQFNPNQGASGVIDETRYGPELAGNFELRVVNVTLRGLFQQTQAIVRNIERLEPLIVVRDFNQGPAAVPGGVPEELVRGFSRPVTTTFTLEVLVPIIDAADLPEPPAPEEPETEEEEAQ